MTITLYELAGAEDDRRFSPYCWRIHMALLHKKLPFETIPWRFTDKDAIAFSGQGKVPVLIDEDLVAHDSLAIAKYLEEVYPERRSLFGDGIGRGVARFVTEWVDRVLQPSIFRFIACDIFDHLHERDRDYFRSSREARFGMSLEEFTANRDERLPAFQQSLIALRATVAEQPFISGESPAWSDYAVFGAFQWARCISPYRLLAEDDPVYQWRERMLDAFDGAARAAKGYGV